MELFNNREIAGGIWITIAILVALWRLDLRRSVWSLISIFFDYKILVAFLLGVLYTLCGVAVLKQADLWVARQMKDTLLWCLLAIIPAMISLNKARENKKYFKAALKENLRFSLVMEFLTGTYVFSLAAELVLLPSIVIASALQAVAERDSKYAAVATVLRNLIGIMGLIIFGHTICQIMVHIREFASLETLRDFILSPFLAIWFLPFLYILSLYATYEEYSIDMRFKFENKNLFRFAKYQAFLKFNYDTRSFKRWKSTLYKGSVSSKEDILQSIRELKRLQAVERNPPAVNPDLGWSPYDAKDFLLSKGIPTKFYVHIYEGKWSATSERTKIDNSYLSNLITYYIEGNKRTAKNLRLVLDIRSPDAAETATKKLLDCASLLCVRALNENLPKEIERAILKQEHLELVINNSQLLVEKLQWVNQQEYSLVFYISNINSTTYESQ